MLKSLTGTEGRLCGSRIAKWVSGEKVLASNQWKSQENTNTISPLLQYMLRNDERKVNIKMVYISQVIRVSVNSDVWIPILFQNHTLFYSFQISWYILTHFSRIQFWTVHWFCLEIYNICYHWWLYYHDHYCSFWWHCHTHRKI